MRNASLVCCIAAGVLAYNGMDGWDWFLLVGLLIA
jgi:hypothetical protein